MALALLWPFLAKDERDHEFAQKFDLDIIYTTEQQEFVSYGDIKAAPGKFIVSNSDEFNGLNFAEARPKILQKLIGQGVGSEKVNYRMNDWSVSRQRYWGGANSGYSLSKMWTGFSTRRESASNIAGVDRFSTGR